MRNPKELVKKDVLRRSRVEVGAPRKERLGRMMCGRATRAADLVPAWD